MNMTRTHGGKTWIAPNVLIREDVSESSSWRSVMKRVLLTPEQKSLYLPNIAGTALSDKATKNTTEMCYGRVTVLSMLSTKISEVATVELTHSEYD